MTGRVGPGGPGGAAGRLRAAGVASGAGGKAVLADVAGRESPQPRPPAGGRAAAFFFCGIY